MKKEILTIITFFVFTLPIFAQIDSINTKNNKLKFDQLKEATNTYLLYFQDSINSPKRDMEIWERRIIKSQLNDRNVYQLNWDRSFSNGSRGFKYQILAESKDFNPISEEIEMKYLIGDSLKIMKRRFVYDGNSMHTEPINNKPDESPFKIDNLNNSFNFEMDMETFSMLPLESGKIFAINFYHPGSKTPPQYYTYTVEKSEIIKFNEVNHDCWVLKVIYPNHGYSEFWISKETHVTIKMREIYDGILRYKILLALSDSL